MPSQEINYLDLKIRLPKGSSGAFEWSLHQLIEHNEGLHAKPKIKQGVLSINSIDLISLLGYLDTSALNEFEVQQFKSRASKEMKQLFLKSVRVEHRNHYTWCLASFKQMKWGKYLGSEESAV